MKFMFIHISDSSRVTGEAQIGELDFVQMTFQRKEMQVFTIKWFIEREISTSSEQSPTNIIFKQLSRLKEMVAFLVKLWPRRKTVTIYGLVCFCVGAHICTCVYWLYNIILEQGEQFNNMHHLVKIKKTIKIYFNCVASNVADSNAEVCIFVYF